MLTIGGVLVNKVGAGEPFAVEGVPMASVDGAIGILNSDAMDRKIDVGHGTDSKILTERCAS